MLAESKLSEISGGLTGPLFVDHRFGQAVTSLGDLDGDGIGDIAVGTPGDADVGVGAPRGSVRIVFLNANGSVKAESEIGSGQGGFAGSLAAGDNFGFAVAALADMDGDGVGELAVGAVGDDDGGNYRGAVWILFLDSSGTVKAEQRISESSGGFSGELHDSDGFGGALGAVGDLDGNGVEDLAVGVGSDDAGGIDRGVVWILFLESDGTVGSELRVGPGEGGFTGTLQDFDRFGDAVGTIGDLDGDGIDELAVGAPGDIDSGRPRGAVWILYFDTDGLVRDHAKISHSQGAFSGHVEVLARFGASLAGIGDLDGDGVGDMAVGAPGGARGSYWLLFLNEDATVRSYRRVGLGRSGFQGDIGLGEEFGRSVAAVGDLDNDGVPELAVGAPRDDDGGTDFGAVWLLSTAPDPEFCAALPLLHCGGAAKSKLTVQAGRTPERNKLQWKWSKGDAADYNDFADPTFTTDYALCVYTQGRLEAEVLVPASSERWATRVGKRFGYRGAGSADGIDKILLKAGASGKASIQIKGSGEHVPSQIYGNLPTPGDFTIQLVNDGNGLCWEGIHLPGDYRSNAEGVLRASATR